MSDVIDWDFETLNPMDFELKLEMESDKKRMSWLFDKAVQKLAKKGMIVPGQMDAVSEFKVPVSYFKYIKTVTRKNVRQAFLKVKKDGIHILQYEVSAGIFKKGEGDRWNICLVYRGTYADKR